MKKTKGFTLIELLVVIAIITTLSVVVMASLNTARSKSRDTKRVSDISNLQLALALYVNKYGTYPVASTNSNNGSNVPTYLTALVGTDKFMAAIPTDPINGTLNSKLYKYGYITDASGTKYCLGAVLETKMTSVNLAATCPIQPAGTTIDVPTVAGYTYIVTK